MILPKFENIKSILSSVLEKGSSSDCVNELIDVCEYIALKHFRRSKFKEEVLRKEGCGEERIAKNLIGDIFENREGFYFQINKYFEGIIKRIDNITHEEIIAKFVVLVRSNVNQRITEIRENHGEPFFKIKKAFESFISRNKEGFEELIFRDKIYIHNCQESEIDFDLPQITESIFLNELFDNEFKTFSIPEVIRKAFIFVDVQDEYNKAVDKIELLNFISKFYKKRLKDNLLLNVEYLK